MRPHHLDWALVVVSLGIPYRRRAKNTDTPRKVRPANRPHAISAPNTLRGKRRRFARKTILVIMSTQPFVQRFLCLPIRIAMDTSQGQKTAPWQAAPTPE